MGLPRSDDPELMDQPDLSDAELENALNDLARLNRLFGGRSLAVSLLADAVKRMAPAGPIRILDIGTGSGDIPFAILEWAKKTGKQVQIVCIDFNSKSLVRAKNRGTSEPEIDFICADAMSLPFGPGSFDFVICSQFLHHFSFGLIAGMLKQFVAVASRGILISDLQRTRGSLLLTWLGTRLFTTSRVVHVDSLISIRSGFSVNEMQLICEEADAGRVSVRTHFPCRLSAVVELG